MIVIIIACLAACVKSDHKKMSKCSADAIADAETIVVEVNAVDSYENANGEVVNLVPKAEVAQKVLQAIQPRLKEARQNKEYKVIAGLLDIQAQMESILKTSPTSLTVNKVLKQKSSLRNPKKSSEFSPAANEFALGFMLMIFVCVTILGCIMCFLPSPASTTRITNTRPRVRGVKKESAC